MMFFLHLVIRLGYSLSLKNPTDDTLSSLKLLNARMLAYDVSCVYVCLRQYVNYSPLLLLYKVNSGQCVYHRPYWHNLLVYYKFYSLYFV